MFKVQTEVIKLIVKQGLGHIVVDQNSYTVSKQLHLYVNITKIIVRFVVLRSSRHKTKGNKLNIYKSDISCRMQLPRFIFYYKTNIYHFDL